MKKYYLSHVDLSEINNVTTDAEQLERAKERLIELELLNSKGNPVTDAISADTVNTSWSFFAKLDKRLRRRNGGIILAQNTFRKLLERRDYYGFFLYLSIWYGFLEWQVPEKFMLYPAVPDALKCFCKEFMEAFDNYTREMGIDEEDTESDENDI